MKEPEYLSDAELLALVETTERGELLHPPLDLKENILTEAKKAPAAKRASRQAQFRSYCLRVGLATAASLAILFIPAPAKDSAPENSTGLTLTQQLTRFTDRLEQGYREANRAFADFDFNFDFNFGGNRDE